MPAAVRAAARVSIAAGSAPVSSSTSTCRCGTTAAPARPSGAGVTTSSSSSATASVPRQMVHGVRMVSTLATAPTGAWRVNPDTIRSASTGGPESGAVSKPISSRLIIPSSEAGVAPSGSFSSHPSSLRQRRLTPQRARVKVGVS